MEGTGCECRLESKHTGERGGEWTGLRSMVDSDGALVSPLMSEPRPVLFRRVPGVNVLFPIDEETARNAPSNW